MGGHKSNLISGSSPRPPPRSMDSMGIGNQWIGIFFPRDIIISCASRAFADDPGAEPPTYVSCSEGTSFVWLIMGKLVPKGIFEQTVIFWGPWKIVHLVVPDGK